MGLETLKKSRIYTNKLKTQCKRGHLYDQQNTRHLKNGWRVCIQCKKISDNKFWEKEVNKEKRKHYLHKYYKTHQKEQIEYHLKSYEKIRKIIEDAKAKPCADCGVQYPYYVMDFDHRDPGEKMLNVGKSRSIKKTIAEISKCDVVCSNCHRERTWKEKLRKR